jgi:hypothetical protein
MTTINRVTIPKANSFVSKTQGLETSADNSPLPIAYGDVIVQGAVSLFGKNFLYPTVYHVRVDWCCGEVFQIMETYINGEVKPATVGVQHYRGTSIQKPDSFAGAIDEVFGVYTDDMRFIRPHGIMGVCYSVFTIPAGTFTEPPVFQARIKGTLVYDLRQIFNPNTDPFKNEVGFDLQFVAANNTVKTDCDESQWNTLSTWVGNAKVTSNQLALDGTGDYVTLPDNVHTDFGTGKFSKEIKFTPSTVTGAHCVISKGDAVSPNASFFLGQNGTDLVLFASTNGTAWNVSNNVVIYSGLAIGVETTFCFEYGDTQFCAYVNGTQVWTGYSAATIFNNAQAWRIGQGVGFFPDFFGTYRSIRLTLGVKRYGGNYDHVGVPYPDTAMYAARPGLVYSDLPALCFADLVSNKFYGRGQAYPTGMASAMAWGEESIGGFPRTAMSLVIQESKPISEWLDYIAMLADCFWFDDGSTVTIVSDEPVSIDKPSGWEMSSNGVFGRGAIPEWTLGAGWSYYAPFELIIGNGTAEVSQYIDKTFYAGTEYVFVMELALVTSGACGLFFNGAAIIEPQTVAGTYRAKVIFPADVPGGTLALRPVPNFNGWVGGATIHRLYWLEDKIIAGSFKSQSDTEEEANSPTAIITHYTNKTAGTPPNYPTTTYSGAKVVGVDTGVVPLISSTLQLPPVFNATEAELKSNAKLARLQDRMKYSWRSPDKAIGLLPGTVSQVVDVSLGINLLALIESITMDDYGRYAITASNYSPAHYPADIAPPDVAQIPTGVILPLKEGASIPTGWAAWTTPGNKLIKGAGKNTAVASTGGSNTINIPASVTGSNVAHKGTVDFNSNIRQTTFGGSMLPTLYPSNNNLDGGAHTHPVGAISVTATPYVSRKRFVKKTGAASGTVPKEISIFGKSGLSAPKLARSLASAGRLLQQHSTEGHAGAYPQMVTVTPTSVSNAHRHFTVLSEFNRSYVPDGLDITEYYEERLGGGSHSHTQQIGIYHSLRQRALSLYDATADYEIVPGHVFGWEGALTAIPLGYTLMDGKLGTFNLDELFVRIGSLGDSDNVGSPVLTNDAWMLGETVRISDLAHYIGNVKYYTLNKMEKIKHFEYVSHSHIISSIHLGWQPEFFALAFIMYNPNPIPTYIDYGFLLAGGGADGSTAIVDNGPDNLTTTIQGAPNYSNAQPLLGLTTIYNTTSEGIRFLSAIFNRGRVFTMEGSFFIDTAAVDCELFGDDNVGPTERFKLTYRAGVGIDFYLDGAVVATSGNPGINAWFYVAVSYDGANWRFYYGLRSVGAAGLVATVADVITTGPSFTMFIGRNAAGTNSMRGYYGQIRHIRGAAIYKASAIAIHTSPFPTA